MIRQLIKALKVLLVLTFDLEASEVKTMKTELTKAKSTQEEIKKPSKFPNNKKLSYDDLVNAVNKNFPLLAVAFQDVKIAEGDLLESKGGFDPELKGGGYLSQGYYNNSRFDALVDQPTSVRGMSFFGGYRLGVGNFPPYYGARETNRYGELRAGAKIPLWRDVSIDDRRAKLKKAQVGLRLADLSAQKQKIEIFREAALKYWYWVATVEKYKISKSLYDIALERQSQIERRVKAGDLAQIEQKDNERILLQRESKLLADEQMMEIMSNELNVFLEGEIKENVRFGPEMLPENPFNQLDDILNIDLDKEIKIALDKRPELLIFKSQKDQNRIDQELARNDMKPGVDLVVAASQDFGPGSSTRSKTELEAAVVLKVPLRTRKQQGKYDKSVAKNKQLDAKEEYLVTRIKADIKNLYKILNVTRQRAQIAKKELSLAKELEKAEIKRFKIGEGTLIIVNIRENTTGEAGFREIDAKANHNIAIINFRAALVDIIPK